MEQLMAGKKKISRHPDTEDLEIQRVLNANNNSYPKTEISALSKDIHAAPDYFVKQLKKWDWSYNDKLFSIKQKQFKYIIYTYDSNITWLPDVFIKIKFWNEVINYGAKL